jgi:hypothetical protein
MDTFAPPPPQVHHFTTRPLLLNIFLSIIARNRFGALLFLSVIYQSFAEKALLPLHPLGTIC